MGRASRWTAVLLLAALITLWAAVFELVTGVNQYRPVPGTSDGYFSDVHDLVQHAAIAGEGAYCAIGLALAALLGWLGLQRFVLPLIVVALLLVGAAWIQLAYSYVAFVDCFCVPPVFGGALKWALLLLFVSGGLTSIALAPASTQSTQQPSSLQSVSGFVVVVLAALMLGVATVNASARGRSQALGPATATPRPPTPTPIVATPGPAHLHYPISVSVSRGGVCWVLDAFPARVVGLGPQGGVVSSWRIPGSRHPVDLAAAPNYHSAANELDVFVAYRQSHEIRQFTARGRLLAVWGKEYLRGPSAVWTNGEDILVADQEGNEVWGLSGPKSWRFSSPTSAANDIFSTNGVDYFALEDGHNVLRDSSLGGNRTRWGALGSKPGQMRDARGIAAYAAKWVVVADTGNNRVERFTQSGQLLAVWATQGWKRPRDVAVSRAGAIYVADTGNKRVVEMSPSGRILRVWR